MEDRNSDSEIEKEAARYNKQNPEEIFGGERELGSDDSARSEDEEDELDDDVSNFIDDEPVILAKRQRLQKSGAAELQRRKYTLDDDLDDLESSNDNNNNKRRSSARSSPPQAPQTPMETESDTRSVQQLVKWISRINTRKEPGSKQDCCYYSLWPPRCYFWFNIPTNTTLQTEFVEYLYDRSIKWPPIDNLTSGNAIDHTLYDTARALCGLNENLRANKDTIKCRYFLDIDRAENFDAVKRLVAGTVAQMQENLEMDSIGVCVMILRSYTEDGRWNDKYHAIFHGPVFTYNTQREFTTIRFSGSAWANADANNPNYVDQAPNDKGQLRMPMMYDRHNKMERYVLFAVYNFPPMDKDTVYTMDYDLQLTYPPGEIVQIETAQLLSGNLPLYFELMKMSCLIYIEPKYYNSGLPNFIPATKPKGELAEANRRQLNPILWLNSNNLDPVAEAADDRDVLFQNPDDIFSLNKLRHIIRKYMNDESKPAKNEGILKKICTEMNNYIAITTKEAEVWYKARDENLKCVQMLSHTVSTFNQVFHLGIQVLVPKDPMDPDGAKKIQKVNICKYWSEWAARRTYDRACLNPFPKNHERGIGSNDYLNLWRWYILKPEEVNSHRDFVLYPVFDYMYRLFDRNWTTFFRVLDWVTSLIIEPYSKQACTLMFVGETGAGKSVLVKMIARLFGANARYVRNPRQELDGFQFSLLDSKILLILDDIDTKSQGNLLNYLKPFVTGGEEIQLREKYAANIYLKNVLNFIIVCETKDLAKAMSVQSGERRTHLIECVEVDKMWTHQEKVDYMHWFDQYMDSTNTRKALTYYLYQRRSTMEKSKRGTSRNAPPDQTSIRSKAFSVSKETSSVRWINDMIREGKQVEDKLFPHPTDDILLKNMICGECHGSLPNSRNVNDNSLPSFGMFEVLPISSNLASYQGITALIPPAQVREAIQNPEAQRGNIWQACLAARTDDSTLPYANQPQEIRDPMSQITSFSLMTQFRSNRAWFQKIPLETLHISHDEYCTRQKIANPDSSTLLNFHLERLLKVSISKHSVLYTAVRVSRNGTQTTYTTHQGRSHVAEFLPFAVCRGVWEKHNQISSEDAILAREAKLREDLRDMDEVLAKYLEESFKQYPKISERWPVDKIQALLSWQPAQTPPREWTESQLVGRDSSPPPQLDLNQEEQEQSLNDSRFNDNVHRARWESGERSVTRDMSLPPPHVSKEDDDYIEWALKAHDYQILVRAPRQQVNVNNNNNDDDSVLV